MVISFSYISLGMVVLQIMFLVLMIKKQTTGKKDLLTNKKQEHSSVQVEEAVKIIFAEQLVGKDEAGQAERKAGTEIDEEHLRISEAEIH